MIDGTYTGKSFQTGEGKADTLTFSITSGVGTSRPQRCLESGSDVNNALTTIFNNLQTIGATIARLTFKKETLRIAVTNTLATKSRILDSGIAFEQLRSTRLQIIQETATVQLAQNVALQNVLTLFQ